MPNSRRHGDESAFTLIEMIIVAVLLIAVITFVMQFLMDIVSREQEGVVAKRATERSMVALDQLGQDLRSTISNERAKGGGMGPDDLDFVTSGYLPGGGQRAWYIAEKLDIISASPWRIQLMVPSGRGTDCVAYEGSPSGRMMRYVADSCPANATTATGTMIVEDAPAGTPPKAPFSYKAYNSACRPVLLNPTPTLDAATGVGSAATLYSLASVRVQLNSYARTARNQAVSRVETEYVFRSRMGAPYQRALPGGCST